MIYHWITTLHDNNKGIIKASQCIERSIKALKTKIYKSITANRNKFCLSYLNKLIEEYNNTSHHYIPTKPINLNYSVLIEKNETNPKAPRFKVNVRVRIKKYKNVFSNGYSEDILRDIYYWFCFEN